MRMKQRFFILILTLCIFAVPALAQNQEGKVQIFGGEINVPSGQTLNGDSVAIFADQKILGDVNGSIVTIFGDVTLKGRAEDVVTILGDVDLMDGAEVKGDLVNILGTLKRLGNTRVLGEVTTIGMGDLHINNGFVNRFSVPGIRVRTQHFGDLIFSIIITALIIHFFLPYLVVTYQKAEEDPLGTGIKGLVGKIAIIIIAVILGITIIGIPVAMVVGLIAWAAYSFANVAMYLLIGERVAEQMKWDVNPYVKGIIGSIIINVLATIPLLGLVKMVVGWVGFGAVIETKFGTGEKWVR